MMETEMSSKRSLRHWLYLMGYSPTDSCMLLYDFLVQSDREFDEFSTLYNPYKNNFIQSLFEMQRRKLIESKSMSFETFELEYYICPRFALEMLLWRPVTDYELKRFEQTIHNDRDKLRRFFEKQKELPGHRLLFYLS